MKNLTQNDIYSILENRQDNSYKTLKDLPQPDNFKDIKKATLRIVEAIKNDETINIVGDYDVDGVVSTTIIVEFFNSLGVEVNYIIPNRFTHGYGVSAKILESIYDGIIITVDNGISAYEAATICKKRGLDLIITDHHTVGEKLPDAYAIVNPKQHDCTFPFKEICGAQVAWYLCAMIKKELNAKVDLMVYFDLLALAIVADVMPMKSLNALMVKRGLKAIEQSNRPAFLSIKEQFSIRSVNEEDIGFKIAPLINCAGRMEDASLALEFLLSYDTFEANECLEVLIQLNDMRKQEQLTIFQDAKAQVNSDDEVIVVYSHKWNEGIIGIVASKLSETYKKPTFVFAINGDIAKGSSRSNSVHLYNLISQCSHNLIGFGGHKGAAGLSINKNDLEEFKNSLNSAIKNGLIDVQKQQSSAIGNIKLNSVDDNMYNTINFFRPFGLENEMPSFIFSDVRLVDVKKMGKNKEFTKLVVCDETNINIEVVIFVDFNENIQVGDKISFVATMSKNEFRGNISYNLMFKELL